MAEREPLHGRDAYPVWRTVALRRRDNNASGHVDNTVHYQLLDEALLAWLSDAGLYGPTADPTVFVAESGCRYAAEIAYPDGLEIGIAVTRIGTSSVAYRLGIFVAGEPVAAAEGRYVHVCVDRATRRPAPFPAAWRAVFERALTR